MEIDKIGILTKRDLERKLDLEKKKQGRIQFSAENEKLAFFEETFTNYKINIYNLIEKSGDIDQKLLSEHFNEISREILQLQKYVAASNIFLRTYDIKKCQESLQELTIRAKDLEDQLLPKKKFGFKNKNKPKSSNNNNNKIEDSKDEVDFQKKPVVPDAFFGFSNRVCEILELKAGDCYKKDVTIENVMNCTIKVFGTPSTLHLNNLKDCTVFTGPVSTSIFADNCENSNLIIACQQLRLHNSKNVNIYLHVTSRAIMEDCHEIFLAPYNLKYSGIEKDFVDSGLDISTNNWQSIDDFNWLKVEKQSPNWSRIPETDLVRNWDNL